MLGSIHPEYSGLSFWIGRGETYRQQLASRPALAGACTETRREISQRLIQSLIYSHVEMEGGFLNFLIFRFLDQSFQIGVSSQLKLLDRPRIRSLALKWVRQNR